VKTFQVSKKGTDSSYMLYKKVDTNAIETILTPVSKRKGLEDEMKRTVSLTAAVLVLFLVACLASPSWADGPRLLIPGTRFDFGYAPTSSKLSHYFLVKNVGSDTLKIENVKPG
jgi:hypothetical protein